MPGECSAPAAPSSPSTTASVACRKAPDFNHVTAQRMSAAGERLWGEGVSVLPSRPPHNLYELFAHPDGGAVVAVVTFPFELVDGGLHLVFQRLAADGAHSCTSARGGAEPGSVRARRVEAGRRTLLSGQTVLESSGRTTGAQQ